VDFFDDKIPDVNKRASLPANWSIQNREDGSASYYFNTLTGEMRSTYPYDDSTSFYEGESDEESTTSTADSNSRTESVLDLPSDDKEQQQGKVKTNYNDLRRQYVYILMIVDSTHNTPRTPIFL
jgi:hypothetical protein